MPNTNVYRLNVCFDTQQIRHLQNSYSVCISKLVNGMYNVVWASQPVSNNNVFEWTEEYQTFARSSAPGYSTTKTTPIGTSFGQTSTHGGDANMTSMGPLVGSSFTARNNWDPAYFCLNQKIGDTYQLIYVSPTVTPLCGAESFTPMSNVIVFLSKNFGNGKMFKSTQAPTSSISFAANPVQTVSYVADPSNNAAGSGIWINGTPPEPGAFSFSGDSATALSVALASGKLAAMIPQNYSRDHGFEPFPHGYDAFKVAELINYFIHKFQRAR